MFPDFRNSEAKIPEIPDMRFFSRASHDFPKDECELDWPFRSWQLATFRFRETFSENEFRYKRGLSGRLWLVETSRASDARVAGFLTEHLPGEGTSQLNHGPTVSSLALSSESQISLGGTDAATERCPRKETVHTGFERFPRLCSSVGVSRMAAKLSHGSGRRSPVLVIQDFTK